MSNGPQIPDDADVTQPNAARIYDFLLGGSHNFITDREAAQRILASAPEAQLMAKINRAYLRRVVTHLVREAGIRQFLDLGSGIPTVGNVHEIAQEDDPTIKVVYVDFEPVAFAHGQLLLAGNNYAAALQADITEPGAVLHDPTVRRLLDFTASIAVLMVSVLPFVRNEAEPAKLIARYVSAVLPGSYLAISHASLDGVDPGLLARAMTAKQVYNDTTTPVTPRSRYEILSWLAELELVEPGVVNIADWRPDTAAVFAASPIPSFSGVGKVVVP